jgi:hypothetical protein
MPNLVCKGRQNTQETKFNNSCTPSSQPALVPYVKTVWKAEANYGQFPDFNSGVPQTFYER